MFKKKFPTLKVSTEINSRNFFVFLNEFELLCNFINVFNVSLSVHVHSSKAQLSLPQLFLQYHQSLGRLCPRKLAPQCCTY